MKFFKKHFLLLSLGVFLTTSICAQSKKLNAEAKDAMLKATKYMVEKVSTNGGYVTYYLPDFSRRWGELEAFDTQIWIQDPATIGMGNVFLDAYTSTGNEYYYNAAEKVADALVWGQLPGGGWNYIVDFAGDRSLKKWYHTIGKNAWGFEEYNHYYGNATFDDVNTSEAATFLLRIYLEKLYLKYKPALDKVINFVLESQYPLGGWPQRYPLKYDYPHGDFEDYTSFYTFNDDVIWGNIQFLIQSYSTLGEERLLDAIHRGMNFYLLSQQGNPQAGWGAQHDMMLKPAHARTYEPPALMPSVTYEHTMLLMRFYQYTGDRRYIARIPDAINWLESTKLPADKTEDGKRTHPTFVEVGTNKSIYPHRTGTGVVDGRYWWDYDDQNLLAHYGGKTTVRIDNLRKEYERVLSMSPEELTKDSPLKVERFKGETTPQKFYALSRNFAGEPTNEEKVKAIVNGLDSKGIWFVKNIQISRPYSITANGVETNTAKLSDKNGKGIVDTSDQQYISTREYLKNMSLLIDYIKK